MQVRNSEQWAFYLESNTRHPRKRRFGYEPDLMVKEISGVFIRPLTINVLTQ